MGILIKPYPFIFVPLLSLYLVFIFFRFKRKVFYIALICAGISIAKPFIKFDIKSEEYIGVVMETKDNYFILTNGLERYYISQYDNEYEIGDILKVEGIKEKLDFITLEGEFDFKEYLNKKGVEYKISTVDV